MNRRKTEHIDGGLSQRERFHASLNAVRLALDGRSQDQLLRYMFDAAREFNFYNLDNQPEGSWQDFLSADPALLLRVIATYDPTAYINRYESLRTSFDESFGNRDGYLAFKKLLLYVRNFLLFQHRIRTHLSLWSSKDAFGAGFVSEIGAQPPLEREAGVLDEFFARLPEIAPAGVAPLGRSGIPETWTKAGDATSWETSLNSLRDLLADKLPLLHKTFASLSLKFHLLQDVAGRFTRDTEEPRLAPHAGLIATFLDLYVFLQADLNSLSDRHLSFYYDDILALPRRMAIADRVHLLVRLTPAAPSTLIPKGALVLLSNSADHFEVEQETVVSPAQITSLRTLFAAKRIKIDDARPGQDIFEEEVFAAARPIGIAGSAPHTAHAWALLGEDLEKPSVAQPTPFFARLGLIISSPVLFLTDGFRTVTLQLSVTKASFSGFQEHALLYAGKEQIQLDTAMYRLVRHAFLVEVSTAEGWLKLRNCQCKWERSGEEAPLLQIRFDLDEKAAATATCQPAIHGTEPEEGWPALRLTVNHEAAYNPYIYLSRVDVHRVSIEASVVGSRDLRLQNNIGPIYPGSPYQLFGPLPGVGAFLDIRNSNIFNRLTRSFTLRIQWFDLPAIAGGFAAYYKEYGRSLHNGDYRISLAGIDGGRLSPGNDGTQRQSLFRECETPEGTMLSPDSTILAPPVQTLSLVAEPLMDKETAVAEDLFRDGTVRLELEGPDDPFGHRRYITLFPEMVMKQARDKWWKVWSGPQVLPNPPYVPIVKELSIDYSLSASELVGAHSTKASSDIRITHLHPFGHQLVHPLRGVSHFPLLATMEASANLFIGLDALAKNEVLSLLFELDLSGSAETADIDLKTYWSFLAHNEWHRFPQSHILSDSTSGFERSGIIRLLVPAGINKENSILPPDQFWLRLSSAGGSGQSARVRLVAAGAVRAHRINRATGELLLPHSVKGFKEKFPFIAQVSQPFPSYGGRKPESNADYRIRVSERLRHKGRAVSARDICQLVLDRFPAVNKVRCYSGHAGLQALDAPPGDVHVLVIPHIKPRTSNLEILPAIDRKTLHEIQDYLTANGSPLVRFLAHNPVYEKVKAVCKLDFKKGLAAGECMQQLNEDIRRFIAPWLFDSKSEVNMDARIYPAELLQFVRSRSYVRFVWGLSLLRFYRARKPDEQLKTYLLDTEQSQLPFLEASFPGAVLVPAARHHFIVLNRPNNHPEDRSGISALEIGNELLTAAPPSGKEDVPDKETNERRFNIRFTLKA